MTDDDIERIQDIFYSEAPYDYVLVIENKRRKYYRGACYYKDKICALFAPEDFESALFTTLHEIAHARIQHKTHSDTWEQEFIRLLTKYNFRQVEKYAIMTTNMRNYINAN